MSEDTFAFILAQNKILECKCISYLSAEHSSAAILFLRGKKTVCSIQENKDCVCANSKGLLS